MEGRHVCVHCCHDMNPCRHALLLKSGCCSFVPSHKTSTLGKRGQHCLWGDNTAAAAPQRNSVRVTRTIRDIQRCFMLVLVVVVVVVVVVGVVVLVAVVVASWAASRSRRRSGSGSCSMSVIPHS